MHNLHRNRKKKGFKIFQRTEKLKLNVLELNKNVKKWPGMEKIRSIVLTL